MSPGSKSVIDSLKDKVSQDKSGLNSESKVPSRVFQMLQKQLDDEESEGIVNNAAVHILSYQSAFYRTCPSFTHAMHTLRTLFTNPFYARTLHSVFYAHCIARHVLYLLLVIIRRTSTPSYQSVLYPYHSIFYSTKQVISASKSFGTYEVHTV